MFIKLSKGPPSNLPILMRVLAYGKAGGSGGIN